MKTVDQSDDRLRYVLPVKVYLWAVALFLCLAPSVIIPETAFAHVDFTHKIVPLLAWCAGIVILALLVSRYFFSSITPQFEDFIVGSKARILRLDPIGSNLWILVVAPVNFQPCSASVQSQEGQIVCLQVDDAIARSLQGAQYFKFGPDPIVCLTQAETVVLLA